MDASNILYAKARRYRALFPAPFAPLFSAAERDDRNVRAGEKEDRNRQHGKTRGRGHGISEEIELKIEGVADPRHRLRGQDFLHFRQRPAQKEPAEEHRPVRSGHKGDCVADARGKLRDGHIGAADESVQGGNEGRRRVRRSHGTEKMLDDDRQQSAERRGEKEIADDPRHVRKGHVPAAGGDIDKAQQQADETDEQGGKVGRREIADGEHGGFHGRDAEVLNPPVHLVAHHDRLGAEGERHRTGPQDGGDQPSGDKSVRQPVGKLKSPGQGSGERRKIHAAEEQDEERHQNQRRDEGHEKGLFVLEKKLDVPRREPAQIGKVLAQIPSFTHSRLLRAPCPSLSGTRRPSFPFPLRNREKRRGR